MKLTLIPFIGLVLLLFISNSCKPEEIEDCIKTSGTLVRQEILTIPHFDKIRVEAGIELILTQADTVQVSVETGSNLIDNITFKVVDNELTISNQTSCNWIRDYEPAKVYITFKQLTRIYSVSQHKIHATEKLSFDQIELSSGLYQENISSHFELDLDCNHLTIHSNDASYFRISGTSLSFYIAFWAGVARIEAPNFKAQNITVFQRSSNDMILHPIEQINGNIYGTGNIILKNIPSLINVTQHYTGSLQIDQ